MQKCTSTLAYQLTPACFLLSVTLVLQDVVSAMFTREFIEELFKPQELYSAQSARQIFDKLAHSSIMRLSVSSMNKLYDLMTMGFKYQLLACNHCGELLEVTLNHLMSVMQMVDGGRAQESVRRATELVTHRYSGMSGTDFCLLRQTLCTHLQGKKIKVSLFLQDGIQRPDGPFLPLFLLSGLLQATPPHHASCTGREKLVSVLIMCACRIIRADERRPPPAQL